MTIKSSLEIGGKFQGRNDPLENNTILETVKEVGVEITKVKMSLE